MVTRAIGDLTAGLLVIAVVAVLFAVGAVLVIRGVLWLGFPPVVVFAALGIYAVLFGVAFRRLS